MKHVKNYLNWLESNMTEREITSSITEITTPFLDRHNDYTQIYLIHRDRDEYKISDDGYIINDLIMSGVDIYSTSKRKSLFNQILDRKGVKYDDATNELYVLSNRRGISEAQHRLLQCMLDVNDLFYLATSTVKQIFLEEVMSFFDDNQIFYSMDISILGKSGYVHTYDFLFQKNINHPERFAKVMNSPSRSEMERVIFTWNDIKDSKRADSQLIVIMNDKKQVDNSILTGFENYDIVPCLWSSINKNLSHFN